MLFHCEREEEPALFTISFEDMTLESHVFVFDDKKEEEVEDDEEVPEHDLLQLREHGVLGKYYEFYEVLRRPNGQIHALYDQGDGRYTFFLGYNGKDFVMTLGYDLGHGSQQGTMIKKYDRDEVLGSLRLLFLDMFNVRVN